MAQYNLLTTCLNDKATIWKFSRDNVILKLVDDYQYKSSEDIPTDINKSIFKQLVDKSKDASDFKQLCGAKGKQVLKNYNNCHDKFSWSVEVEFDHSILLWHIATDLCFLSDQKVDPNSVLDPNCVVSKLLSDYMLYLLVKRSFMLPNGIGHIRFQHTCAEATEFFQGLKIDGHDACGKLLQVNIMIPPQDVKGDRSKSVLFDACKLAKCLQCLESEEQWRKKQKWEMVSHLWIEILSYTACQCRRNESCTAAKARGRADYSCLAFDGTSWFN